MIPAAFGDEFGIVTTNDPDDTAHALLCHARAECFGYFVHGDELLLVMSAELADNGAVHWTVHRCAHAGHG